MASIMLTVVGGMLLYQFGRQLLSLFCWAVRQEISRYVTWSLCEISWNSTLTYDVGDGGAASRRKVVNIMGSAEWGTAEWGTGEV